MYCLCNFFNISIVKSIQGSPLFEICVRKLRAFIFKKKGFVVKKHFKLFSVSRGFLSILQPCLPAVWPQTLLSHRRRWGSSQAAVQFAWGRLWTVMGDKVINFFCEIRTMGIWAFGWCYQGAIWPWECPETRKAKGISPGSGAPGLCSASKCRPRSPHQSHLQAR